MSGPDPKVHGIIETLHLGRDHHTLGCALYNAHLNHDDLHSIVTVAPWDWKVRLGDNDKSYLNKTRFSVLGNITAWKSSIHSINYTLAHHVETDEDRDWDGLKGRLLSWTGEAGGNDNGVSLSNWKHGIYNHALSKVELTTSAEDKHIAGVCQGLTAAKDAEEIVLKKEIHCFQLYHGHRQTIECADKGDTMVWAVVPLSSEVPVTARMLSGKYQKSVNMVATGSEVVINVNEDHSFTLTESTQSIMD